MATSPDDMLSDFHAVVYDMHASDDDVVYGTLRLRDARLAARVPGGSLLRPWNS
jgi:hypothetical protein